MSLSSGDGVPHIFTRKSRLQPGEFLITSAKRLLQQYLPKADSRAAKKNFTLRPDATRPAPFFGDGKMSVLTVVWEKVK